MSVERIIIFLRKDRMSLQARDLASLKGAQRP